MDGIFLTLVELVVMTPLTTLGPSTTISPTKVWKRFFVVIWDLGFGILEDLDVWVKSCPSKNCLFICTSEESIFKPLVLTDLDNCFPLENASLETPGTDMCLIATCCLSNCYTDRWGNLEENKDKQVINWNQTHCLCLGKFYIIRSQEKNPNQNRYSNLGPPG